MTHRWQQTLVDYLFVIAEAVVWFMAIALIATWTERDLMSQVANRIRTELPVSADRLIVLNAVEHAADHVISGPSVVIVALAGLLAFVTMRGFRRLRLDGLLASAGMLVVTIVALNVLLHVTYTHNVRFWETGGTAAFLNDPASQFPRGMDLAAFVADPRIGRPHGGAIVVSFVGLGLLWVRFLIAGRGTVTFDRAARSFSIGFVATLVLVVLASLSGVTRLAGYAVPYFVIAVLMLAVAHSARPQAALDDARRAAPWVVSVVATIGALTVAALILGLLALVDAGTWFQFVVDGMFRFIGWVMVLVLTPLFWVAERLLSFVHLSPPSQLLETAQPTPTAGEEEQTREPLRLASSVVMLIKIVALSALMYGVLLALRALLNRGREPRDDDYEEVRTADATATGLGGLFRNLIPHRGPRGAGGEWMRRHAVYQLFGRLVRDAEARGLRLRPAETPIEFATIGARMLDAPPFPPIAAEFDRARYGRHFPEAADLAPLDRALTEWANSHPPSEELRERIQGARQPTEAQEIEARILLSRRANRGDENAKRLL